MKAPAYQMYAAEWLADEQVTLLSIAAEGVYIRLLNFCWREGSIPSNPAHLAPLCKYADVKVIKEAVALFSKSPAQPGRLIHKRLEAERAKQEEYRAKQSAKGKAGGRPRKDEKPEESHGKATALPQLNHGLTTEKPVKSSSTSSSMSTNVDEKAAAAQPLKANPANAQAVARAADNGVPTFTADTWPGLTDPTTFAGICADLRLPINLDKDAYRAAIQDKMRGMGLDLPATSLRSWISSYFMREKKSGPLLTLDNTVPSTPTPRELLPPPGREQAGQVLAFLGERDAFVNKMLLQSRQREYPQAQVHIITPR